MVLICNYSSRIIPPIQSRCAIFRFSRLGDDEIASRLKYIADKENVKVLASGIEAILYLAEGDMRAAINLVQAASSTGGKVTDEIVYSISGRADPESIRKMLDDAKEGNYTESLASLRSLIYQQGVSPVDLVKQVHREIESLDLDNQKRMEVLDQTAEIEFRVGEGANGEIQISSLLARLGIGSDSK
jgi:replication factor C small subunit